MQAPTEYPADGFDALGLSPTITTALAGRGIHTPTDVQSTAIPYILRGASCVVQAKTGTGKTYAFGLPLLQLLSRAADADRNNTPTVLVITPTRELCIQVTRDLDVVAGPLGLSTVSIYGGVDQSKQATALGAGVDIVIGTPGRLLDLAQQRILQLGDVRHVVLDEADEMLDMGFLPDVTKILNLAAKRTQTLLFSATMPAPIITLARRFSTNLTFLHVADPDDVSSAVSSVSQHVYLTHPLDKPEILARILQTPQRGPVIVFCRTRRWVDRLTEDLNERGFPAVALHGDLSQNAREAALEKFRTGSIDVLVATDVAARGIDIDGVSHVVNYDMPEDAATYLHRIGRTARAGRDGTSVTLVDVINQNRWKLIAETLDPEQRNPVETFSTSAHLQRDLGFPADAKGRVKPPATHHKRSDGHQRPSGTPGRSSVAGRPSRSNRERPDRRSRRSGGSDTPRSSAKAAFDTTDSAGRSSTVQTLENGRRRRVRRGR